VVIGGFDPTGGAGVVRDFITARALRATVRMIPSAWTEQSPSGVAAIEPRGARELETAIRTSLIDARDREPCAVKIGMVPDATAVDAVVRGLSEFEGSVVLDPVLCSSSGGRLFREDCSQLRPLLLRATVVTPNLLELAELTRVPIAADVTHAGRALISEGIRAVLVKGGHADSNDATDVLFSAHEPERRFTLPRLSGPSVRGTGCALSTAIAVELSRGLSLPDAVAAAKRWLHEALQHPSRTANEWHLT